MTIHHSLTNEGDVDLEVARGTPLQEIVASFSAVQIWCGAESLDPGHPAGRWPLVAGCVLSAHARRASVAPNTLHLAAIAGPDAGVMIPIHSATVIGSAPPRETLKDDAIDAHHATVSPTPAGELRVTDNGSVNGTGVWRLRGGSLSWRGRRRHSTVRVGDVIAIGRSFLEARQGLPPEPALGEGSVAGATDLPMALTASTLARGVRRGIGAALSLGFAQLEHAHLLRRNHAWSQGGPPIGPSLDPTRADGWAGSIAIGGTHAIGLARAVILARGRRPPAPMPFDEPWLSWLPPALPDDGAILMHADSVTMYGSGWTVLEAETDRTTSRNANVTWVGPVVRVTSETADVLARSQAWYSPDPVQRTIHWADAAALSPRAATVSPFRTIVAGVSADRPSVPWEIVLDPDLPHTVVAGAAGSGKTTLLATIAGALALKTPPRELSLAILCAGTPGALEPYLDLPHVSAAARRARPSEALSLLDSLDTNAALTVIIFDDIDALGPDGRAVTASLEAIAARAVRGRVHVVMATQRPTAVLTPTLRARIATGIALRTACASDSLEVTGVGEASRIPLDALGMAFVRSAGRIEKVQVALPYSDAMPRVRRWDAPLLGATTLASAARDATRAMGRVRPARTDPAPPAS